MLFQFCTGCCDITQKRTDCGHFQHCATIRRQHYGMGIEIMTIKTAYVGSLFKCGWGGEHEVINSNNKASAKEWQRKLRRDNRKKGFNGNRNIVGCSARLYHPCICQSVRRKDIICIEFCKYENFTQCPPFIIDAIEIWIHVWR